LKPYLRDVKPFKLIDYPESAAYEAGFLVTKNAGWRSVRPVINEKNCSGCLRCYLHCPDGVIFQKGEAIGIDYDFCKGCGICAKICGARAIEMRAETA